VIPFHGLSVMFMHCAQTAEDIDMISFAYSSPHVSTRFY